MKIPVGGFRIHCDTALTAEKSKSRATKMLIGDPCGTLIVGGIWPSCEDMLAAAPAADWGEPMEIWVDGAPEMAEPAILSSERSTEPPNRAKKWELTSPVMPPRPKASPPGEPIWI